MLQSQAERITKEAFRRAVLKANTMRKDEASRKLDYYNDEQASHILAMIAANYKNLEGRDPVSINVVKKVIKNLATVYLSDATRTVEGTERDRLTYSALEDCAALPLKMKLANRYAKLLGTILLRPVWRGGKMDLDVLTPDVLDVITGDSPEDIQAVMLTLYADSGKEAELQYSFWTPATIQRLDYRFQIISEESNPYGVLPFVPAFSQVPTDFWLPGANDLMMVQDAINKRLSDIWHTLDFQSFGVGFIKGAHKDKRPSSTVDLGPGSLLFLPENGEVGFASPDAPVEASLAAIEFLMKQAAITNGLPAASMSLDPTEQSGISRIVGNAELEEQRRDDIAMFAKVEQQLFGIFRTVWNVHNPTATMSEAATLRVDFYDPKPTVTAAEQVKEWQGLLELGLISPVDILIERNPDLSRDDAKAELLRIRDELKEFQQFV